MGLTTDDILRARPAELVEMLGSLPVGDSISSWLFLKALATRVAEQALLIASHSGTITSLTGQVDALTARVEDSMSGLDDDPEVARLAFEALKARLAECESARLQAELDRAALMAGFIHGDWDRPTGRPTWTVPLEPFGTDDATSSHFSVEDAQAALMTRVHAFWGG